MRVAKIIEGVVVNIECWDAIPESDSEVTYVSLDGDSFVSAGFLYDGVVFTAATFADDEYDRVIKVDASTLEVLERIPAFVDESVTA